MGVIWGNPLVQFIKYWLFEKGTDGMMRKIDQLPCAYDQKDNRISSRRKEGCNVSASTFLYIILYIASFVLATVVGNALGGVWWPLIVTNVAFFGAFAIGSIGVSTITGWAFRSKAQEQRFDEHGLLLPGKEDPVIRAIEEKTGGNRVPEPPASTEHLSLGRDATGRRLYPSVNHQWFLKRLSL